MTESHGAAAGPLKFRARPTLKYYQLRKSEDLFSDQIIPSSRSTSSIVWVLEQYVIHYAVR